MKNKINGIEVSPFKAEEHERLSAIFANTITFMSMLSVLGFILFALYQVAEAELKSYTIADIKAPQIEYKWQIEPVDMDALAKAVARHETASCTKGHGVTHNNCFGIMWWPNGERTPIRYKTKEDSFNAFKDLWVRKYGGLPTYQQAVKYSGNDRANIWHSNVLAFYNEYERKLQF